MFLGTVSDSWQPQILVVIVHRDQALSYLIGHSNQYIEHILSTYVVVTPMNLLYHLVILVQSYVINRVIGVECTIFKY